MGGSIVNIYRYILINGTPQREKYTFVRPCLTGRKENDPLALKIKGLPGRWVYKSGENLYGKVEPKRTGDGGVWYGNPFDFPLVDGAMQIDKADYDNLVRVATVNEC